MRISFKPQKSLLAVAFGVFLSIGTRAASINYILNQSNVDAAMPDGNPYATVMVEDGVTLGSDINAVKFTVKIIDSAFSSQGVTKGNNFGIDDFGFNIASGAPTVLDSNIVSSSGWAGNIAPPPNQLDGFGRFAGEIKGNTRLNTLIFWITGVTGDSIGSYAAPSSGNAGQGNAWFAAHIAGFSITNSTETGAYFGGGNGFVQPDIGPVAPVPLPAALWFFVTALVGGYFSTHKKVAVR